MILDVPTLMLAGAFVGALCAAALLSVWLHNRESAALWWSASCLTIATAVALIAAGSVSELRSVLFAGLTLNTIAPMLFWLGIRVFHGRSVSLLAGAGLPVWFAVAGSQGLHNEPRLIPLLSTLAIAAYNGAAIWELSLHGNSAMRARRPLIALLCINIVVYLLNVPAVLQGKVQSFDLPPLASLFGLIHFETMIFLVGVTVALVTLIKEKSDLNLLRDAQTDTLTGLANRRAFYEMADRVTERCKRQGHPIATVVFDLDHFKNVNDTYGHAFGDTVLRLFAKVVREGLRPGDVIGRVGGEEFFAVLPDTDLREGCATANRVRSTFAAAGVCVEGRGVKATVSAGVTASNGALVPLTELFENADAALYQAKLNGRNRVECREQQAERLYPRLVRVA